MIYVYAYALVTLVVLLAAGRLRGPARGAFGALAAVLILGGCAAGAYLVSAGLADLPALHF
jgi:hypothetical protein